MKTVLLYVCVIFLISCQKEIIQAPTVKEQPAEVVIPEPPQEPEQPEDELKDSLDPAPGTVSESVYLRNLPLSFNSNYHYKLAKIYTSESNMWADTPDWLKDDIHTLGDYGNGTIESVTASPNNSFTNMEAHWSAYVEDNQIKLDWVDQDYNSATYTLVYAVPGVKFKASRTIDGETIYYVFETTTSAK